MDWPASIPGCPYRLMPVLLGGGGYAFVLEGVHVATGVRAAIKTYRPLRNARDREPRSRLKREIKTMSSMSHPHVMPIIEVARDLTWYAMPVAAGSMFKIGRQLGPDLVESLRQVALGMSHAHALGFVHRDLTPGNILLLASKAGMRWVVADWGLVSSIDEGQQLSLTLNGEKIGTPGFRAPEMYEGERGDERSDVYSLGRVAAWSLSGKLPQNSDPIHIEDPLWRRFVATSTARFPGDRPTMYEVLVQLSEIADAIACAPRCWRCRATIAGRDSCDRCGSFLVDHMY